MILNIRKLNFGCGLLPKVLYVKNGEGQTHIVYDAFIKTLSYSFFFFTKSFGESQNFSSDIQRRPKLTNDGMSLVFDRAVLTCKCFDGYGCTGPAAPLSIDADGVKHARGELHQAV